MSGVRLHCDPRTGKLELKPALEIVFLFPLILRAEAEALASEREKKADISVTLLKIL